MKMLQVILVLLLGAAASGWAQTPSGYEYGLFLLDAHHWDEAAQEFNRVAAKGGAQADAALYWKAYAFNKAQRPVEAMRAVAELHRLYPMSPWVKDAEALAVGEHLTSEPQPDEELKLLALNALVRTDPEHAVPAVESLLKQTKSPAVKREALYVLAQSDSPKAQELMEQVARGKADPDLQVLAVRYLVQQKRDRSKLGQVLFEIYNSTADADLKHEAINGLAAIGAGAYLQQISTPEAQMAMELAQLNRLTKDMAQAQSNLRAQRTTAQIATDYQSQKDRTAKQGIIDAYAKNAQALIAIGRVETDPYFKRKIVEHLIDLNTPEAKEYLLEILK